MVGRICDRWNPCQVLRQVSRIPSNKNQKKDEEEDGCCGCILWSRFCCVTLLKLSVISSSSSSSSSSGGSGRGSGRGRGRAAAAAVVPLFTKQQSW